MEIKIIRVYNIKYEIVIKNQLYIDVSTEVI